MNTHDEPDDSRSLSDDDAQTLQDRIREVILEFIPDATGYALVVLRTDDLTTEEAHVFKDIHDAHMLAVMTSLSNTLAADMVNDAFIYESLQ